MTVLVLSPRADRDVDEIFEHLTRAAGVRVARNYERHFDDLFVKLIDFPEMGPPQPSLGRDIRIGGVDPYIVFYRFIRRRGRIDVLRILHGHRNIDRRLFTGRRGST